MALIDIYVADNSRSDIVLWVDSALTSKDIGIQDVQDLADYVTARCSAGDKLRELRIVGHGNPKGQWIGSDWVTSGILHLYAKNFHRIARCFAHPDGFVTMGGCKVGQNPILLGQLSAYFRVPVRAFTSSQNPVIPGDEGTEIKCYMLSCTKGKPGIADYFDY